MIFGKTGEGVYKYRRCRHKFLCLSVCLGDCIAEGIARNREGEGEIQTEGEINKLQNNKKKSKRIRAMLKNKNKSKRSHQNELNDMKTNTRTHCCQRKEGEWKGKMRRGREYNYMQVQRMGCLGK